MALIDKLCVLALDVSGSVQGFKFYWEHVDKLLNELLSQKYSSYKFVSWSSKYYEASIENVRQYIKDKQHPRGGGTNPHFIWNYIQEQKPSNYELYIITDGEIFSDEYNSYVDAYDRLDCKPDAIYLHYCGRLNDMNMEFLDCFENVKYVINGLDTNNEVVTFTSVKSPKDLLFPTLCELVEFKAIKDKNVGNLTEALENLYKTLYRKIIEYSEIEMNGAIGVEFKKFVDLVNKVVHRNFIDVNSKDESAEFDGLFADYKSNSKEIFDIFVKRFDATMSVDYRKILSQIIELGNGQLRVDRRLMAYGNQWYERVKNEMMPNVNVDDNDDDDDNATDDDENDDKDDTSDANASCPILLMDSSEYNKFCVLWISIDSQFGGSEFHSMLDIDLRRKMAKNAMLLFENVSQNELNKRIPPANQHISIDAFIGLESIELNNIGSKRFKRIYKSPLHQVPCFGIVLYNAYNKATLPAAMTQNEMNVLLHNYATLAKLLFGESKFVGSFPLLYTFFLQILSECKSIDQYIKMCIKESIKRTSNILKCKFMIQSGLEPNFTSSIRNSIIFHTDIYPNEIDKLTKNVPGINALNIPRRNIQCSSHFFTLAKDIFGVEYSDAYERKLNGWKFWNYMLCTENMTNEHKMLHFKQIALSKIQNWQPIECDYVKIMFIEGKSTKAYLEYLNDMEYEEIVKLIILYDITQTRRSTTNISTNKIKLVENGEWHNIKTVEKIVRMTCNVENIEFCKACCAVAKICPYTKLPHLKCFENQKFNLSDYGYPDNNSTFYAHSYVEKCKKLIRQKTGDEKKMQIPTVDELKKYIVRKTPLAVYHTDIDALLTIVIKKFHAWNNWYENADDNEKNKYLWINSDWKKIFSFKRHPKFRDDDRLLTCDCDAHNPK